MFAVALLRLLRFLRRPQTTLVFVLLTIVFGLPLLYRGLEKHPDLRGLEMIRPWTEWIWGTTRTAEEWRNDLVFLGAFVVPVLVLLLAANAARQEARDGSRDLLRLTKLRDRSVVLGEALGLSLVALLLHSFVWMFLVAYTPAIREAHVVVAGRYLAGWLWIVGFVPAALAWGGRGESGRIQGLARKMALVGQGVALAAVLETRITPAAKEEGLHAWDALGILVASDPFSMTHEIGSPLQLMALLLTVHAFLAGVILLWLSRERAR